MKEIKLTIPGKPIPKKAVKTRVVRGKVMKFTIQGGDIKTVTKLFKLLYQGEPLLGAVRFDAIYYMAIPKGTSKKKRAEMIGKPHDKRPDKSNLNKFYEDCLNGIAYHDDGQIADGRTRKIYDENPRAEIIIKEIG
jgi:Holliday junction resolvase RusA-like endonuclease